MNPINSFLLVLCLITILASIVVFAIRKPLGQILVEICGNQNRGQFWQVFSYVFLILSALTAALLFPPDLSGGADGSVNSFSVFLRSFRAGVFGILLSLSAIGFVMMQAILARSNPAPEQKKEIENVQET